jgi:glycosyltransferase involved in cell wall biosynthesis
MSTPKISVIVPVYNAASYLEMALQSVLTQSETDLEIIAINDASSDDSLQVLQTIAAKDARVRVLNRVENAGVSAARNWGLRQATGDWIAFLDGDDFLEPDAFKTWLQQAQAQSVDVLVGNGYRFSERTADREGALLSRQPWGQQLSGRQWVADAVRVDEWPHYVWMQLLRRDFVEQHGIVFRENMVHEDIVWTVMVALNAQRVGFCEQAFYGYRINVNSITGSATEASVVRRAQGYIAVVDFLLIEAFALNQEPVVQNALLHQAIQECGHLFGLIRKRLTNPTRKSELAVVVMDKRLMENLFPRVGTLSQFAVLIRFSWLLLKHLPERKSFSAYVLKLGLYWLSGKFSAAPQRR